MLSDAEKILLVCAIVMIAAVIAYVAFMKWVMADFDAYLNKRLIEEQTRQFSICEIVSSAPQKFKSFTNELMQSMSSSPIDKEMILKADYTPLLFESPSEPPFGYV